MNFKKLSNYIIILAVVILGYGGMKYATNQPVKFDSSKSKTSVFGGRDDISNLMHVQSENHYRDNQRDSAVAIMIAGGIVFFMGIAVSASSRKKTVHQ